MKSQTLRQARILLSPFLFLFITAPVLKAGKIADKSFSVAATNLLNPPNPDQQLLVNLMVMLPGNVESLADGLRIRYNDGYLRSTVDDILKMNNFAENISSYRENKELIVERRPVIELHDTIYLRLTNTTIRDYRLKLYTRNFVAGNMLAYIEDAMSDSYRVIDITGDTTNFNFTVTSDPASRASNRFRIIFVGFGILPVHFTGIEAQPKPQAVQVRWTTANEMDIKKYDIEKSPDGHSFLNAGSLLPHNSTGAAGTYTWLDINPLSGNNYYRIRSTGFSGEIIYSDIVKAAFNKPADGVSVFPNPVTGHTLQLTFSLMVRGVYSLNLINNQAQVVFKQQLNYAGGSARQNISFNSNIAPGNYILEIWKPDSNRIQKRLVILQ
jgi:hypothetical protein